MATEADPDPKLEIGHVLVHRCGGVLDACSSTSKPASSPNSRGCVRATMHFRVAEVAGKLLRLPTGDGMVLVFFNDPEAPIKCAMEIAAALKEHPDMRVRMGIHSGPGQSRGRCQRSGQRRGRRLDIAQRVMDCGDAGHILLSRRVAYDLAPSPRWNANLYELGDYEAKHGQKISLVNFYTGRDRKPGSAAQGEARASGSGPA